MILKLNYNLSIIFILFFTISNGQNAMIWKLSNPQLATSPAVDSTLNVLENTKPLEQLFEKLYLLKTQLTENHKVIFTHIGDSHIQADKITTVVRNEFQDYFGNAGRGLIFPFHVAKTNSPYDVFSSSNELWKSSRLSKMNSDIHCGIAGYGIKTNQTKAEIKLAVKDSVKNSFDQVSVFYAKGLKKISIDSTVVQKELLLDSISQFASLQLPSLLSKFKIKLESYPEKSIEFYGVSISKSKSSGVIYNAIGANGAKIIDYNEAPIFWEQLPELKTDCYIISLGTNEAQNQNLTADLYTNQLKTMVEKIKVVSPEAAIVVLSPPVSYFRKINPNKSLPVISAAIKKFCYQNNLVFWDFFQISKGTRGTLAWRKLKLLNTDLVHFANAGYSLQGELLCVAFAKAFNEFTAKKQL